MASHTRPFLTSGAALASAAAVVLATPAIAPTITASPLSVSSARYDLTTFSDVFTIPVSEWINAYFQGYGGIVGPNNPFPLEPYASDCNGTCVLVGASSLAYLALDALVNGNGNGWDDVENWDVSAVNYLFEADWSLNPGGISAGVLYLLQTSIGSANPLISTAITLAFAGPALVTIVFDNALQLLGDAALGLPLVGAYAYGAINAFLGPASLNPDFQSYFPGVSGVLNYTLDVLSGTAPTPPEPVIDPAPESGAAVAAAALTAAEPVAAEEASGNAAAETPAVEAVEVPAAVADSPSVTAADAQSDTQSDTGADTESVTAADAESVTGADAESAPATAAEVKADTADAAEAAPAAQDRPAKAASKRPVRDAVAKVTSSIASSIGSALGAPAADAADAGAADSGSTADSDS